MFRVMRWILSLSSLATGQAFADPVSDFYKGRNIDFIVGAAAGGGFDQTARPMASFLSKYLPGKPSVVVRNMPGGAGVIMTNYLVSAAPADGTVIGMGTGNIPYEPRLNMLSDDGKNIRYDPKTLVYIGNPVREPQVSYVWHENPVKSWEDMRSVKIRFGATAASGDNAIFPALANRLLGLKSEIITGYKGVSEILLAIERGELDANNSAYSTVGVSKPDWQRDGKVRYLMQFSVERLPELKDVPSLYELVSNEDDKKMLRFFFLKFEMHRPIYAPPGVPSDRIKALRTAFDETMKDPDFLTLANKMGLGIRPIDGSSVEKLVDEIMGTPQPIVDRLRKTLEDAGIK
jgi:tripartite-type tricarboxylate transporter receptor subunit TctC